MGFSPFLHSANLVVFVVVLYFHAGSSTTSVLPSVFVSQSYSSAPMPGQTTSIAISETLGGSSTTSISPSPSVSQSSSSTLPSNQTTSNNTINATLTPTTTTPAAISTSSVVSTATPPKKTIVRLSCIQLVTWKDTLQNSSSEDYKNLTKTVTSALEALYSDSSKHDLDNSSIAVNFTKYGENVQINAEVGFTDVFDEESGVEDKFLESVKEGTLSIPRISEENAKATPIGVTFGEWKAGGGECKRACSDSETSTGQSFNLVRTCTEGVYSCKGLKKKKQTKDCKTYCDSSVASHLSFSLTGLVMTLLAPLSLQL